GWILRPRRMGSTRTRTATSSRSVRGQQTNAICAPEPGDETRQSRSPDSTTYAPGRHAKPIELPRLVLLDGDGELTNRREPSGNVTSSGSTPPQNSPLTTGGTRLDFSVEV